MAGSHRTLRPARGAYLDVLSFLGNLEAHKAPFASTHKLCTGLSMALALHVVS